MDVCLPNLKNNMQLPTSLRFIASILGACSTLLFSGCAHKASNPIDPFEPVNRKVHAFNMALDHAILRPAARVYRSVLPAPVRAGVNNFYNNIYMIPTVANDLLQGKWRAASDDAGRFVINTSIGIAGLFDVAKDYHLPLHKNDLGLTFAQWGYKKSKYIVIPFLGPSTFRDGISMAVEYTFMTPYPYIADGLVLNILLGVRYVDLRSQFLDTDKLLDEALDQYTFLRDAYLQNRNYLISGENSPTNPDNVDDPMYVDEAGEALTPVDGLGGDYVDE